MRLPTQWNGASEVALYFAHRLIGKRTDWITAALQRGIFRKALDRPAWKRVERLIRWPAHQAYFFAQELNFVAHKVCTFSATYAIRLQALLDYYICAISLLLSRTLLGQVAKRPKFPNFWRIEGQFGENCVRPDLDELP